MTEKMFYKKSWWRSALAVLLIMCMLTTMMVATTVEAEALAVLPGLFCGAGVALTIGALLAGSGVPMSEENSAALINAFYWGCDAEQLAIIESFSPGQAIGDLFDVVSGWVSSYVQSFADKFYCIMDSSSYTPIPKYTLGKTSNYHFKPDPYAVVPVGSSGSMLGCSYTSSLEDGTFTILFNNGNVYEADISWCIENYNIESFCIYPEVLFFNGSYTLSLFMPFPNFSNSSNDYVTVNFISYDSLSSVESKIACFSDFYDHLVKSCYNGVLAENDSIIASEILSEYLPTSTDTEKVLTTTTPVYVPQTWEQLWDATPEIVRTGTFTGTGGTTDPDNPDDDTDIVVGPATGTITGDGTGTGVFEGIGKWLWEIPILAEIYALGQQIRSIVNDGFGISSAISSLVSGIQGTLQSIWTTVTDILSPVTGILTGVQSLVTSVGALASGEVPAELQDRIYQFSGQIFDLLSWDEMSQSMAALENMGSGYGEPPVITLNLHRLVDTAQGIGHFKNTFDNEEVTVIDFEILEDERFQFMGMTIIEWIRLMFTVSMIWYTAWYVWEKIVPDDAVR